MAITTTYGIGRSAVSGSLLTTWSFVDRALLTRIVQARSSWVLPVPVRNTSTS